MASGPGKSHRNGISVLDMAWMFATEQDAVTFFGTLHWTEAERREAVRKWANAPAVNPRYKGATPADIVRTLLRPRSVTPARKVAEPDAPVKPNV